MDQPKLTSTDRVLGAFEGQPIRPVGYFQTLVKHEDLLSQTTVLPIYVSRRGVNIIGKDGQKHLNIVMDPKRFGLVATLSLVENKIQDILSMHADLFKPGLGCCPITRANLVLRDDTQPKYCKQESYRLLSNQIWVQN